MNENFLTLLTTQLDTLKKQGLYKEEREISSPQGAKIAVSGSHQVINLCANNYLGLANHTEMIQAAKDGLDQYGFGMASVRFICGTQTLHRQLERNISTFLGTEETILYSSCFDANGGLFETLLGPEDVIISDELNHASIIDGIRLSKAKRLRYKNNSMEDLEDKLREASDCRFRLIATDGVFSMDGIIANLQGICDLAQRYQALVMIDDCHATGFLGKNGKGTPEYCDVLGRVDIITSTLGKALGGASGGFTSGKKELIDWLRQRSRPYLFSNALSPAITHASLKALDLLKSSDELRSKLEQNSHYFRNKMTQLGFDLVPGNHPIIPIMLGDAKLAKEFASRLLQHNIFVVGFSYPVVPKGRARIRTQMSASHSIEDLDQAAAAFEKIGRELGIISRV